MSKNEYGEATRADDQEGGKNNVFAKDGIHYKANSSVDLIRPHNEWMVYHNNQKINNYQLKSTTNKTHFVLTI